MIKLLEKPALKPEVLFTSDVWQKIKAMVSYTSTECALSGFVATEGNRMLVHEVSVYPQDVLAVHVDTNDEHYIKWLLEIPDKKIRTMRFQMHSHVNMGVTPSAEDVATWAKVSGTVTDYHLFMIMNKKYEYSLFLYDVVNNLIYDKEDLDIDILLDFSETTKTWYTNEVSPKLHTPVKTLYKTKSEDSKGAGSEEGIKADEKYETPEYLAEMQKRNEQMELYEMTTYLGHTAKTLKSKKKQKGTGAKNGNNKP